MEETLRSLYNVRENCYHQMLFTHKATAEFGFSFATVFRDEFAIMLDSG